MYPKELGSEGGTVEFYGYLGRRALCEALRSQAMLRASQLVKEVVHRGTAHPACSNLPQMYEGKTNLYSLEINCFIFFCYIK